MCFQRLRAVNAGHKWTLLSGMWQEWQQFRAAIRGSLSVVADKPTDYAAAQRDDPMFGDIFPILLEE